MIGRAAQGRPWIFREIHHFLATGKRLPPPRVDEIHRLIIEHLADHYAFYGEGDGVRIARKHLGWYTSKLAGGDDVPRSNEPAGKLGRSGRRRRPYFGGLAAAGERLVYAAEAQIEASWVEEALAA